MTLTTPTSTPTDTRQNRIASIDILRALTMVLMIFVNDLWSLQNIPLWLEHTAADEDGMGLADVVFPAFLFIVGMSIPFAINNRRKKGDSDLQIIAHILIRGGALLVMGVFLVNGENINAEATGMPNIFWDALACLSFILIWNSYPASANKKLVKTSKILGVIILLFLAFIFRGGEGANINRFSTYWWGILGLIGWAYIVSSLVYTFFGKTISGIVIAWAFFNALLIISHAGLIESNFVRTVIGPLGDGSMPALTLGGVVISMIYLHLRQQNANTKMLMIFLSIAVSLLILGFYTRMFWGISKIHATPAWVLICSGITILAFVFIYWLADIKGKASWFDFIKPAGTNTLLCYLIPYFIYMIVEVVAIQYPDFMLTGITGLIKSLLFALLVVFIAGWLGKKGVQLKL